MNEKTKRRTIHNIPTNLDMLIQKEAEENNVSINKEYLKIIRTHCDSYLEKEFSFNPNADIKQILLENMKNQIEILEILKQQQKYLSVFESYQEE